jgi:hypothetical protein
MHKNVEIAGPKITDWESFHNYFSKALGFPEFYGRNMNAWIDCMTCLDDPEANMTSIRLQPGEVIVLSISGVGGLKTRCSEIYDALIECSAFVNYRRMEKGLPPVLVLAFDV